MLLFKTMNAFHETEALQAAIELDLFSAMEEGLRDARAIADRCRASERGVRILCDYLTILGFLNKNGATWELTPDTAMFLSRKSPAYLGSAIRFLHSPMFVERFAHLAGAVRKGGTADDLLGTMAPDHPIWVNFARSMAPMMYMPAEAIAKLLDADAGAPVKVLDIAAGHGRFGITLARHNPQAEVFAVDWQAVLEVAQENAAQAGVASRYHTIPGSAFAVEFGSGYDIVLLTNFLHHFSPETNKTLLRKVHAALKPGGRAVTLEFVPNDDRISPPNAAGFSLIMLATTEDGDAYTLGEYERMFDNAGFSGTEAYPLPGGFQTVLVSQR